MYIYIYKYIYIYIFIHCMWYGYTDQGRCLKSAPTARTSSRPEVQLAGNRGGCFQPMACCY